MHSTPHAFALFSGGLDSILAARLIMEQGWLSVACCHLFRQAAIDPHWRRCTASGWKPWTSVKRSCAS